MGDNGGGEDGWHLVAAHPAIEIREQKQIAEWELSDKSWSGQGKHPTNWADHKTIRVQDRELGAGSYGHVERIIYKAVTMARKHVLPKKRMPVDKLREEASVMERLDHKHILKLVGTYTLKGNGLFLLLYPAAVCDLSTFLEDVDDLRSGNCADREDTLNRLRALGLNDVGTIEDLAVIRNAPNPAGTCPRTATAVGFLQQILGCITEAVAWIHKKDIRHRDLKPKNILLSPGRVYLADFGIARDVRECENSLTFRRAGTLSWIAPEVFEEETHHMSSADIWALGSIFLNITTMLYGERLERFEEIMKDRDWPDWEKKYQMLPKYLSELRAKATSAKLRDHQQPDFNVKNIIDLIDNMLEFKAERRPCATEVISRLSELGGLDQIYHLPCCHKSNKEITAVINNKLKLVSEKNTEAVLQVEKLKAENEKIKERLACLEEIQSTWERRLANELKHAGDQYKVLQDKYNKEIETQKKLEEKIKTTENKPFRRPRSQNRGRGRSQGILHPNAPATNFHPHKNKEPRTQLPNQDFARNFSRRTSGLPLPVRPATPIRPSLNRDPGSGSSNSTLVSLTHSTFSRRSNRTNESFSSVSSSTLRSSSPGSPIAAKPETSPIMKLSLPTSPNTANDTIKPKAIQKPLLNPPAKPSWANIARSASVI